jgi:hypothetical protein
MEGKKDLANDPFAQKFIQFYGLQDNHSVKQVSRTCVSLIVSEYFDIICSQKFKIPPIEDIREWVMEEWNRRIDDGLVKAIEEQYPDLSEDEIDEKVGVIEKMYEKDFERQLTATTKAAFKELKNRVVSLQKEVINLKKKYTS